MDYTTYNDEALLGLIHRRQEMALSALYDRYSRLVFSLAVNALGDHSLAEEVTQDVFLRVWEKAETFRPEQGKVVTWMTSITRNRTIDVIRRRSIRPEGNSAAWSDEPGFDLPDPRDVESEVESAIKRRRVRLAMAQLPEDQKQALTYAFFLGYSHSQIAEALKEPLGTVKTRIRLAMQKLRQLLQEERPHHDKSD